MLAANILLPLLATLAQVEAAILPVKRVDTPARSELDLGFVRRNTSTVENAVRRADSDSVKRLVRKPRAWRHKNKSDSCGTSTTASPTASPTPTESSWDDSSSSDEWITSTDSTPPSATSSSARPPQSTSAWTLVDTVQGSNFFDSEYWNFWSWDDPTHGDVTYVDAGTAWNDGLISVNSAGNAIMKVETTPQVNTGRKSVRIHSERVWTGGLVLMDALHMPVGCGTWPAWWQNGPNWPEGGEIDILEGVNEFGLNQISLHTGRGCTMPNNLNDLQTGVMTTGGFDSFDCSSANTQNQGCGVRDNNPNSYGHGFNNVNGGVYALKWAKDGVTGWFFPRDSIPEDIKNDSPNPEGWGTPVARFPSTNCNPYEFFYDNFNIFDTTLCGDWAGADNVWNYAGYAGQDQSCAAMTGYSSCVDYVRNNGAAFENAFWEVSYVKYFNSTSEV